MILKQIQQRFAMVIAAGALCAAVPVSADTLQRAWELAPGDRPYLGGGNGYTERGVAYNAATGHLLVVSRLANADTGSSLNVAILNAADGAHVGYLNIGSGVISGGTFAISMIGISDDGAIYVANLTTGSQTSPFKVYRWADEGADTTPTLAYSGDPGQATANAVRWGDSFDVKGGGVNTRFLAGARATAHVAVFTTTDGENFTSKLIAGAGNSSGNLGVALGSGNTGWAKLNSGNPLRHFTYDLSAGTSTLIESIAMTPSTVAPLGADSAGKYLGVVATDAQASARVYDVSAGTGVTLIGEQKFTSANANANGIAAIDIGGGMAFFVNPNNGILALNIVPEVTPVSFQTHPASTTVIETGLATLTVSAQGSPPLTYQWTHATTNLPGATKSSLTITNASANDAGDYTVIVSNGAGPQTSNPATLTVQPLVRGPQMTKIWSLSPAERPYLLDDNNTRGIAYNKVSGNLLLVSRTGLDAGETAQIRILDGATGADKGKMTVDNSIVTGGTFTLNMIGVADDGAVYAANLTTGAASAALRIYRWDSDATDAVPALVYIGDPSSGIGDARFGDSFDVRGSGDNVEILVGTRNGNNVALIKPNADPFSATASLIEVPDAPAGAFGLSVAFGAGNSFYGTSSSSLVRHVTYEDPTTTEVAGTIEHAYTSAEIPTDVSDIAFDPASKFLAGVALENPDNVQLYSIADDGTATLVDQELFTTDNQNANGTGSLDFGGGKLFAIDSNNGIIAFTFNPNPLPGGATLSVASGAGTASVSLNIAGTVGAKYDVEGTSSLTTPVSWTKIGSVTITAGGSEQIVDNQAGGAQSARFYRAVAR